MYEQETKQETDGYCGGFQKASRAAEAVAARVLPQGRQGMEEGACGRVEPPACSVVTLDSDDTSILADWPRPVRAVGYVLICLTITGVVPLAAAALLIWAVDALGCAWVLPVGLVAVCAYGYRRCGL